MSSDQTLLIIDGNGLVHRAFHALPDFKSKNGIPTNAVYGFASVMHKVKEDIAATHIIVCFDTPEPTFRDEMFDGYRTQRPEVHPELIAQFPMVDAFLDAAGIPRYEHAGVEADDLIAATALAGQEHGLHSIILSADKDLLQLVSDDVLVMTPTLGFSKGKLYDPQTVHDTFGVMPDHIPDYKALVGDPSDNYKGVKGIGPKAAVELIAKYGTVEDIYARIDEVIPERVRTLLLHDKESALLSKKLAVLLRTIDGVSIDIDAAQFDHYNDALRGFCDEYEFRTLEKRFFPDRNADASRTADTQTIALPQDQLGLF